MPRTIEVRATLKEEVSEHIAVQLCSDFLEWVEEQGFTIEDRSVADNRAYHAYRALAVDFVTAQLEERP